MNLKGISGRNIFVYVVIVFVLCSSIGESAGPPKKGEKKKSKKKTSKVSKFRCY